MIKPEVEPYHIERVEGESILDAACELSCLTNQKSAANNLFHHRVIEDCEEAFVARSKDNVIGMAAITGQYPENDLLLESIYVHPLYRGKGIATQLVTNCIERTMERRCSGLIMHVATEGMWRVVRQLPAEVERGYCVVVDKRGKDEELGGFSPEAYRRWKSAEL